MSNMTSKKSIIGYLSVLIAAILLSTSVTIPGVYGQIFNDRTDKENIPSQVEINISKTMKTVNDDDFLKNINALILALWEYKDNPSKINALKVEECLSRINFHNSEQENLVYMAWSLMRIMEGEISEETIEIAISFFSGFFEYIEKYCPDDIKGELPGGLPFDLGDDNTFLFYVWRLMFFAMKAFMFGFIPGNGGIYVYWAFSIGVIGFAAYYLKTGIEQLLAGEINKEEWYSRFLIRVFTPIAWFYLTQSLVMLLVIYGVDITLYITDSVTGEPLGEENDVEVVAETPGTLLPFHDIFYGVPCDNHTKGWYVIPSSHCPSPLPLEDNLSDPIPHGIYDITVTATNYLRQDYDNLEIEPRGKICILTKLVPLNASVSGLVWHDSTYNGYRDYDENEYISNVEVTIYNKVSIDVDPGYYLIPKQTKTTQSDGTYKFTNLLPGLEYCIQFTLPPESNYAFTLKDVGDDDSRDSDVYQDGFTDGFTLKPNEEKTNVDAGVYIP